jgi:phosphopantetheinyl transferase (holo-ACP synthase)
MKQPISYKKYVDLLSKEEFLALFSNVEEPGKWFSEKESGKFSLPVNSGSLGGRYLIKKRIGEYTGINDNMNEIEIFSDNFGKPEISFSKNMEIALERTGIKKIRCSISHSRRHIAGMTIFCF